MPDTGEFEYVKPPHFYIDKASEPEEDFLPHIKKREKVTSPNPLISGKRHKGKRDPKNKVTEVEIILDDENTTTKKIIVTESSKPARGCLPKLHGLEMEVAEKYMQGMSLQELADLYGVSVPTLSATVKRAGGDVRKAGRPKKG